jgi:hypothetical protein
VRGTNADHELSRGDTLLARLLSGEAALGSIENNLLREFHRGYPISKLRVLLQSGEEALVGAGIWIASELGSVAAPLLDEILELSHHTSPRVRFFALDCILSCSQPSEPKAVLRGLELVDDAEASVRWKALVFVTSLSEELLDSVSQELSKEPGSPYFKGVEILRRAIRDPDSTNLVSKLSERDPLVQRFAAAAAARVAARDSTALRAAMASSDLTVRQFATDMAERNGIST